MIKSTATPFGTVYFYDYDSPIGTSLDLYGHWAPAEAQFLRGLLDEGDVAVDGGANVGSISLALADKVGPTGDIIAIEPSPDLLPLLRKTLSECANRRFKIVPAALGAETGRSSFTSASDAPIQNLGMLKVISRDEPSNHVTEVEVITIDSLELDRLKLIKLDIEGQELPAITGAARTISRCRPFLTVELNELDRAVPIVQHLTALEYKPYFCSFPAFSPQNIKRESQNVFGHASEAMILFSPDSDSFSRLGVSVPEGAVIEAVGSIDQLAELFLEMPRYGDETDHERKPDRLIEERKELREQLHQMTTIAESHESASDQIRTLQAMQASLTQLVDEVNNTVTGQQRVIDRWERAIVELKMEQTALREALLGRAEDRSQLSLRIRGLEEHLAAYRGQRDEDRQRFNECQSVVSNMGERLATIGGTLSGHIMETGLTVATVAETESRLSRVCQEQTRFQERVNESSIRGRLLRWLIGVGNA